MFATSLARHREVDATRTEQYGLEERDEELRGRRARRQTVCRKAFYGQPGSTDQWSRVVQVLYFRLKHLKTGLHKFQIHKNMDNIIGYEDHHIDTAR